MRPDLIHGQWRTSTIRTRVNERSERAFRPTRAIALPLWENPQPAAARVIRKSQTRPKNDALRRSGSQALFGAGRRSDAQAIPFDLAAVATDVIVRRHR